jgi:uncharacterized protein (DUF1810 family)
LCASLRQILPSCRVSGVNAANVTFALEENAAALLLRLKVAFDPIRPEESGVAHPPDLEHFVAAQEPVWDQVLQELKAGRKESHWMWFIFPQHVDLGRSQMARRFGLASLAEAQAYLAHPVLGARLREASELVNAVKGKTAFEIFSSPDDMKLRSSMTLFHAADAAAPVFGQVLAKYFGGRPDERTLELLKDR